jgi:hypothetical protein
MDLLSKLPKEIILIIGKILGAEYIDDHEAHLPLVHLLYATSKRFSWLANYGYGLLNFNGEYGVVFTVTTIDGILNGPVLKWMNYSGDAPSGYSFYKDGKRIGDNIGDVMLASNYGVLEINDTWYEFQDECYMDRISTCYCEWCTSLRKVFSYLALKSPTLFGTISNSLNVGAEELIIKPKSDFDFGPIHINTPSTLIKSSRQLKSLII